MDENFVTMEINYTNEYGEEFNTKRKVFADWSDDSEIDFLHNTYAAFLNNFGYPVDSDEEIIVLGSDEYITTDCDGDCSNCY